METAQHILDGMLIPKTRSILSQEALKTLMAEVLVIKSL